MHPDWEVLFFTDAENPPPPWGGIKILPIERPPAVPEKAWKRLGPAVRSDLWRWWRLGEHGGLYSDTDVIFCGSVQSLIDGLDDQGAECGLTLDCGTRMGRAGLSIGVVTSHAGCKLFKRAAEWLVDGAGSYQSCGTRGLIRMWPRLVEGVNVGRLPGWLFYPFEGNTSRIGRVWSSAHKLPEGCLAIHWYGGRKVVQTGYEHLQECPVKDALVKAGWPATGCPNSDESCRS
jgi:hypothetical protein